MSPLKRCLLLLNVVLQDVARSTTATSGEVRRRPEHAFRIACCQVRSLLSKHSAGHALERVHQMGYRDLRRIVDEQIDVMIFALHLDTAGSQRKPWRTVLGVG
jgi:hypothetical protein